MSARSRGKSSSLPGSGGVSHVRAKSAAPHSGPVARTQRPSPQSPAPARSPTRAQELSAISSQARAGGAGSVGRHVDHSSDMDSNGVEDTVETHGSVEETTSPDDDVSVCSELSSVQHRIYLLKHKIGRGRIADSSTSILGTTVLNSTQCAAQVEFLVNNKLQARSFLAWCGAYKAISFRKSTLLTNAFRVLHLNRIHRSDGHGDYIIRGSCMDESCGGVGELGSMISELTYGYGEEQDDEGISPFDTPTSERSEQDWFNLHTQHHAFQRRVALRKDENVSTPRASVLHRHRVYNKVYGDKENDKCFVSKNMHQNIPKSPNPGLMMQPKVIPSKGSSSRVLSSLWYEYEQLENTGHVGEENHEEVMTVGSEELSIESTETVDSKSTFDPCGVVTGISRYSHSMLKTPPASKSSLWLSKDDNNDDDCSSNSSDMGILQHYSTFADDTLGNSKILNSEKRKNLTRMLINHGDILPSRSPTPVVRKALASSLRSRLPAKSTSSSTLDPETLRGLSSIKVRKQTSSMRRKLANVSEYNISNSRQEPRRIGEQKRMSPPPPPPPSTLLPSAISSVHVQLPSSSRGGGLVKQSPNKGAMSPRMFLTPTGRTHDSYGHVHPADTTAMFSDIVDPIVLKTMLTRTFRRWYYLSKGTSNLRLMAEDHFFKRHVFLVFDSMRRVAYNGREESEAIMFYQQKSTYSCLQQWINYTMLFKERNGLINFMDDYFQKRLKHMSLLRLREFFDFEERTKITLINHFAATLRKSIRVWHDNISFDIQGKQQLNTSTVTQEYVKVHANGDFIHPDVQTVLYERSYRHWRFFFDMQCHCFDIQAAGDTHFSTTSAFRLLRVLRYKVANTKSVTEYLEAADMHYFKTNASRVFVRMKKVAKQSIIQSKKLARRKSLVGEPRGAKSSPLHNVSLSRRKSTVENASEATLRRTPRNRLESVSEESEMAHSRIRNVDSRNPLQSRNTHNRNMSIFSKCFVVEDNEQDLRALFDDIDTDGSGAIEFNELCEATKNSFPGLHLTSDDVSDLMEKSDLNGDGVIDFNEFRTIMREAKNHVKTRLATTRRIFNKTKNDYVDFASSRVMSKNERGELGRIFNEIDTDNSGTIDFDELKKATKTLFPSMSLTSEDVRNMVVKADLNNDGVIDFDEFCIIIGEGRHRARRNSGHNSLFPVTPTRKMSVFSKNMMDGEQKLKSMFDSIDSDKSGTIDMGELYVSMKKSFADMNLTLEDVQRMMEKADLNDDGFIDFEEFCIVMEQTQATQALLREASSGGYILSARWLLKWQSRVLSRLEQETLIFESSRHYAARSIRRCLFMWQSFTNKKKIDKKNKAGNERRESISYKWYVEKNKKSVQHISNMTSTEKKSPASHLLVSPRDKDVPLAATSEAEALGSISSFTPITSPRGKRLSLLFQRLSATTQLNDEAHVSYDELNQEQSQKSCLSGNSGGGDDNVVLDDWLNLTESTQEYDADLFTLNPRESRSLSPAYNRRSSIEMDAVESVIHKRTINKVLKNTFEEWSMLFHSHLHWREYKKYIVIQSLFRLVVAGAVSSKLFAVADAAFKDSSRGRALKRWFDFCQQKKEKKMQKFVEESYMGKRSSLMSSNIFSVEDITGHGSLKGTGDFVDLFDDDTSVSHNSSRGITYGEGVQSPAISHDPSRPPHKPPVAPLPPKVPFVTSRSRREALI